MAPDDWVWLVYCPGVSHAHQTHVMFHGGDEAPAHTRSLLVVKAMPFVTVIGEFIRNLNLNLSMRSLPHLTCTALLVASSLPSQSILVTARPGTTRPPSKANWRRHSKPYASVRELAGRSSSCKSPPVQVDFQAPKTNVWYGLSDDEVAATTEWLFEQADLNLTAAEEASSWDNTIDFMQLLLPNKTDALLYLDGVGPAPPRYAQVSLDLRATENATLTEIAVGPLPVDEDTSWEVLTYPYSRERRGSIRNTFADDLTLYYDWLSVVGANISDITLELWNKTATGSPEDELIIYGIEPMWEEEGKLIRWDTFWAVPTAGFDATSLLPQGLFFKSDITGRDPSKWRIEGFLYNDILYESEDEFREAFFSEGNMTSPPHQRLERDN